MRNPDVSFRAMSAGDLPFVVAQHLHHFPDGFFARLGPRFLREYYRGFLTGRTAWSAVAEVDGERAGFLVGVTDPVAHREHVVRRHGRGLAARAVLAMARHPGLATCFVRTRARLYAHKLLPQRVLPRTCGPSQPATGAPCGSARTAVLTHVVVAPHAQSRGVGSELIERFEADVAAAGCERLTLVTASGDDGAGPYYRRRGWTALGERRTPDGLCLTAYERPVGAHAEPATDRTRSEESA